MPIARSGQKEMESLEEMLDRALVASVEGKSHHRNVLYTYARRCGMRAAALVGSFNTMPRWQTRPSPTVSFLLYG
jgi:hypothetical protein